MRGDPLVVTKASVEGDLTMKVEIKAGPTILAFAAALTLAACGSNREDRIASGAGVGAASGAAVGAIFGGLGAIPGALIGAGIGGVTGGVTDQKDVDLGKPVWR